MGRDRSGLGALDALGRGLPKRRRGSGVEQRRNRLVVNAIGTTRDAVAASSATTGVTLSPGIGEALGLMSGIEQEPDVSQQFGVEGIGDLVASLGDALPGLQVDSNLRGAARLACRWPGGLCRRARGTERARQGQVAASLRAVDGEPDRRASSCLTCAKWAALVRPTCRLPTASRPSSAERW